MSKRISRLIVTLTIVVSGVTGGTVSARNAEDSGYVLELANSSYGKERLQVCNSGVRVDLLNYGVTMVATSPDWSISAYCNNRKTFCIGGKESEPGRFQLHKYSGKLKSAGKVVVKGLPAERWAADGVSVPETEETWISAFSEGRSRGRRIRPHPVAVHRVVTQTTGLPLDKSVYHTIDRMFLMPAMDGIPIEFTESWANGHVGDTWKLTAWRPMKLTASVFALPRGYKKLATIDEIMGDRVKLQMEDFAREFDKGSP